MPGWRLAESFRSCRLDTSSSAATITTRTDTRVLRSAPNDATRIPAHLRARLVETFAQLIFRELQSVQTTSAEPLESGRRSRRCAQETRTNECTPGKERRAL